MRTTADAAEAPMTALRSGKSQAAFRTISEVADELDVAQHVLRFWESKFPQVRPLKRGGGRRYYRPEDIDLLRDIRSLLYDEGYTIKGAQKLLRQRRARAPATPPAPTTPPAPASPPAKPSPPAAAASRPGGGEPSDGENGLLRQGIDAEALASDASVPAAAPPAEPEPVRSSASATSGPSERQEAAEMEKLRQVRAALLAVRRNLDSLLAADD